MNKYPPLLLFVMILSCVSLVSAQVACDPISRTAAADGSVRVVRGMPYTTYAEGHELLADIYLPNGLDGPFPTILMIHGGAWFAGSKAHVAAHARYASERGYAVVAIDYRLAPTYKFPAQLDDCESALRWITANAGIYAFDLERLAVYGYSAGGHLACLLGLKQNAAEPLGQPIRAIVAGGAPCEFSWIPEDLDTLAYWLGGSRRELPEIYAKASPVSFIDPKDPPVYLFHGDADRIVPLRSPQLMLAELRKQGVTVSLHVIAGGHLAAFTDLGARQHAVEFLDKHLESGCLESGCLESGR